MSNAGNQISGSAIAYDFKLRTVTAPGGKAVRLSGSEMAIFTALARQHPKAVRLLAIPRGRRHVFLHRLRTKLSAIGCGVQLESEGYTLQLANN